MRLARLACLTILIAFAIAACSAGSNPSPTGSPSAAPSSSASSAPSLAASPETGDAVSIAGFSFKPASITIPVGTTVTWTNTDSAGHTVTADDGSFTSATLATGATFSQSFTAAGTFAYHCSIHPSMTATIIVQ
jgi:plastocyanin